MDRQRRLAPFVGLMMGIVACSGNDDGDNAASSTGGRGGSVASGATGGASAGTAGGAATGGAAGNVMMTTGSAGATGGTTTTGSAGSAGSAGAGGSAGTGGASSDAGRDSAPDAGVDAAKDASSSDGPIVVDSGGGKCISAVYDWYALRMDGKLLDETADQAKTQIAILDAATGLPLTNVVHAAGGQAHGCAVLAGGTVACWREAASGSNVHGQLGNGTTDTASGPLFRATPVLTGAGQALMNVAELTHGADDDIGSCAVTHAGQLWCWGDVTWILNNGAPLNSAYAMPVTASGAAPLDSVVQASMSPYFACAVVMKNTGREVWCWGSNYHGNVGPSDKMPRQYPTKVLGLTDPSLVRVVGYDDGGNLGGTACAIDGNQVRCWGSNAGGVAGVGSATTPILSPTSVVLQGGASMLSGADTLESGPGAGGIFCAHTTANAVWCWGNGFASYAANYGASSVVGLGNFYRPSNSVAYPRFLTSDGLYHAGPTAIAPNCGAL
jgi:hypothetical protein